MEVFSLETPPGRRGLRGDSLAGGTRSPTKVAIGTFDGVHLGHRQVLQGCDTVLTFDPHPMRVLEPHRVPGLLSDRRQKLQKLGSLGIRRVVIVPFDHAWSRVSAEDFVESVVLDRLGAQFVSVGQGFRFGAWGAGTAATFDRYPELGAQVVPLVTRGPAGEPVSSTRIRRLVSDGDLESAADLLGASLTLPAVVAGEGRLLISSRFARPAPGLYLGFLDGRPCTLEVCRDHTVAAVGAAPTGTTVEVTFVKQAGVQCRRT
ncbi:FAD synthetase [Streptomyces wuyuanensis]|uniref:FAD synthetase n=1 Tax=Streptomyces wuyuanensis TaxID=1196353 RepID=UPI003717CBAE